MCDICNMSHCPPECPAYGGEVGQGEAVGRCVLCDEILYVGAWALEKSGALLCEECVSAATLEDVLSVAGVRDAAELFCGPLGFRQRLC